MPALALPFWGKPFPCCAGNLQRILAGTPTVDWRHDRK
jgi:hypothetical protein